MTFDLQNLALELVQHAWPLIRIGGLLMVMPAIGARFVPASARALLALALTLVIAPTTPLPALQSLFSFEAALIVVQEVILGVGMGFIMQLVFDAITLGGQTIAMSMGLGFAVFIDRARGVNVPVLGQFFLLLATLIFLALNGHLKVLETIALSFRSIPMNSDGTVVLTASEILSFSSVIFTGAVQIAIPAVTALLIANLAFGVMSRAAPTLNLFAVGFPVSLLFGIVVIFLTMDGFTGVVSALLESGLVAIDSLGSGGAAP